jgi:uncharacterized protein
MREAGASADPGARASAIDWPQFEEALDAGGYAIARGLLRADECAALIESYTNERLFRSTIVMARHGFGQGEYRYFAYPLPEVLAALRSALYAHLAPIANRWNDALGIDSRYPPDHQAYLARCHRAGQTRPTPLILRYREGDYNCLHQDLYGAHVFPLQATLLLSRPDNDFAGGEFVLTEQRPRRQSRVEVVPLERGDAVIFPVHHRPVRGVRGFHRTNMRHGVSRLRSGERYTAGIIFHDAK